MLRSRKSLSGFISIQCSMLRSRKSLSGFISIQCSIFWQRRSASGRRCYPRSDNDDDKARKREENEDGKLYLYKSWGQHILTNPRILGSIVRKSEIRPFDTVLEIGPGTGNLTLKLLEAAKKVVAIEIDNRMVEILENRVLERGFQDRLTVIRKDALKAEFPQFDIVVANIPYGISSPLVAKLVYGSNSFRSATLLLQKEFARRLLASPGDSEFNRLAVNVKLVADVELVMDVSKRDFLPCPKVDSSVVMIRPKADIPDVNLDEWWAFTRACFSKKNRTLGATFKQKKKVMELWQLSKMIDPYIVGGDESYKCTNYEEDEGVEENIYEEEVRCSSTFSGSQMRLNSFKEKIIGVLKSGCFEDKRPSKLSNEELLRLLALFNQAGIYFHDKLKSRNLEIEQLDVAYT
ncbi:LOW QUALITY PROTEIN: ribosomal RNA small subunit methyltransferase, mitochondrial [Ziziphus jujuba]|uniref:rRNA adenine N(6)-methyltransferase n=1 Tax=Ziziphus jujuba TaxID=326968 RepID=A0A6P6GCZ4_ZIZJJ|nr:LOW QUALITY PROTEIN: ribosomal RNA small subunit methyltransferase, mitochondrial [Ziziphus jujuba]